MQNASTYSIGSIAGGILGCVRRILAASRLAFCPSASLLVVDIDWAMPPPRRLAEGQKARRRPSTPFAGHSLVFIALLFPMAAFGQSGEDPTYGNEISLHLGSLLPNQIDGVTEILPVFGGRYGLATPAGVMEFGIANSHAQGVDFTTFEFNLRGEQEVADQISLIAYGGLDFNYYTPINQTKRETATGVHFGSGLMMHVANTLWLRSELKFMGGPGTSLYLGFGLVFRGPGGGGGGGGY